MLSLLPGMLSPEPHEHPLYTLCNRSGGWMCDARSNRPENLKFQQATCGL